MKIIKIAILLVFSNIVASQNKDIYTCINGEIYRFNPQNCEGEIVCNFTNLFFNDIAFAPDGVLYGINVKGLTVSQIVKINLDSCHFEIVSTIPAFHRGMMIDNNGIIYLAGESLYTYDLKSNIILHKGNFSNLSCSGDLFFFSGKLFMTGYNQSLDRHGIFEINIQNPINTQLSFFTTLRMEGALAITNECGLKSKAFGFSSLPKPTFVEIDIENDTIYELCNIGYFSGATSVSEFLASDPECDLLLDLDRDNSSGAYPYDYNAEYECFLNTMPICDNDVHIYTSQTEGYDLPAIDSIVLILSGIKDNGLETLIANPLPNSIVFNSKNDSTYILKSNTTVPDTVYRNAMKAIRYRYSQFHFNRQRGYRSVKVTAYSDIKVSTTATAFFFVSRQTYAGNLSTFNFCDINIINEVSKKIQAEEYGRWVPSFASNSDLFNSELDTQILYKHITNDSICGEDTALVVLRKLVAPDVDLGGDTSLCNGESINVQLQSNANVIWNDGDTSTVKSLAVGKHTVIVTNSDGCQATDSININLSDKKIETVKDVFICEGSKYLHNGIEYTAGQSFTQVVPSLKTCDTLYSITVREEKYLSGMRDTFTCDNRTIIFNNNSYQTGDTINIIKQNEKSCDSLILVVYKNYSQPLIEITTEKDTICIDDFTRMKINGGVNYIWKDGNTNNERTLQAGLYQVTITDSNGCIQQMEKEIFNYENVELNIPSILNIKKNEAQDLNITLENGFILSIESNDTSGIKINGNIITIIGSQNKTYNLTLIDANGCKYLHELTVVVNEEEEIIFPNIIYSSSNTSNNQWHPIFPNGYQLLKYAIYDRWGNKVFSTSSSTESWDGKSNGNFCLPGVYMFEVIYLDFNQTTIIKKGDITLVR